VFHGPLPYFINELDLKESHLLGHRYTWINERDNPTMEKLDCWLCSVEWEEMHPDVTLVARSSSLSDHCPILMSMTVHFVSKSRFHFERFWINLWGFQETMGGFLVRG
jgi:hypothetical protein